MGHGVAKVHEKPIPKQLSDMPIVALDDFRTSRLIGTDDFPVLFGIELARQFGRVYQIAKHDGELAAFSFWRRRLGGSRCTLRRLVWLDCFLLSQLRGNGWRFRVGFASPNKSLAVVIDNRMNV